MRGIHNSNAGFNVVVFMKLTSKWTGLEKAVGLSREFPKRCSLPALRDWADLGLFLGFVPEAAGEELVEEHLFQFGGERQQPLLLLHRPLH
jgi:hypothetical protein